MNFTLNDTQQKVLEEIADAEMRSVEQMLSMLLVQGVRFYFCDYTSPFYNEIDADKLENQLRDNAKTKTTR
jgi:predicted peroxiredoxin|tara:strand:+ start:24 stop:236 length:213 start_codon:yes stop_codon:yes gene_type:complete